MSRFFNESRFVNHSCLPNLTQVAIRRWTEEAKFPIIGLVSLRDVEYGEPLTMDYGNMWLAESVRVCNKRSVRGVQSVQIIAILLYIAHFSGVHVLRLAEPQVRVLLRRALLRAAALTTARRRGRLARRSQGGVPGKVGSAACEAHRDLRGMFPPPTGQFVGIVPMDNSRLWEQHFLRVPFVSLLQWTSCADCPWTTCPN